MLKGEGSISRKCWRMDRTMKGVPTGIKKDFIDIEGDERGYNGWGKRQKKR